MEGQGAPRASGLVATLGGQAREEPVQQEPVQEPLLFTYGEGMAALVDLVTGLLPVCSFLAGFAHHPFAQRKEQPDVFCHRDEA